MKYLPVQMLFAHDLIGHCSRLLDGGQMEAEMFLKFSGQKLDAQLRVVNFFSIDCNPGRLSVSYVMLC